MRKAPLVPPRCDAPIGFDGHHNVVTLYDMSPGVVSARAVAQPVRAHAPPGGHGSAVDCCRQVSRRPQLKLFSYGRSLKVSS